MCKDFMKSHSCIFIVALMLVPMGIALGQENGTVPVETIQVETIPVNGTMPVAPVDISNAPIASSKDATSAIPPLVSTKTRDISGSEVAINWENVTLKDCIEVLCRDLGMEFVISPSVNVSQEVSVRAGDVTSWDREHKLELFDSILDTAGVQRVQRGRVWVFAPSEIRPVLHAYEDSPYSDGRPIIGVIELKYADAKSATDFLNNIGGKPERVYGMSGSQIVMVIGTHAYLKQMEELVKLVDVEPSVMKSFSLVDADSEEMTRELTNIFYRRTGGDGQPVRFVSVPRLNMVVAYNASPNTITEIEKWITILDRSDELNERVTKVYRMQVIEAETLAKMLNELYSSLYRQNMERDRILGAQTKNLTRSTTSRQSTSTPAPTSKTSSKSVKPTSKSKKSSKSSASAGSSQTASRAATPPAPRTSPKGKEKPADSTMAVDEEAIILADKETNTLIINAPADMHKEIERTIKELDRARRQVLIETVLVEVTLDDNLSLGIEWAVTEGGLAVDGKTVSAAGLQSGGQLGGVAYPFAGANNGLSYLIDSSNKKMALIQAAENDDRLQVISSPTVLTRDGMEATVSFGSEVPIQQRTSTDAGKESFSYDYRDAKITLTVTPHIDDFEMVTLALVQELRSVNPSTANDEAPSFFTRELSSNLQVENGQTLILGGLIQRKDQQVSTGIPWLSRIPYIGWMFGSVQTIKQGSEILMILTPHVVNTRDETDMLTREFRHKILGAMGEKDIRTLYDLEDGPYPLPATTEQPPAQFEPTVIIEEYTPPTGKSASEAK
ncbi:MAG: hypothetical protein K9M45_10410 [Kiritimatiellales bacterium]|nr:hypothetical protein [Kiritimatiellales bacterium]